MKKLFLIATLAVGATLLLSPLGRAAFVDFPITVTVPTATGVNIVAVKVITAGNVFGTTPVSSFNFDPMTLSPLGVWLPDHYYAVDVGVTGGSGSTNITLQYTEGLNPNNNATNSLGYKTTATFVRITGGPAPADQVQTPITTSAGSKALLTNLTGGVNVTPVMLSGGFFRAYVGIYPGDDVATLPQGKPFTNADVPGTYTGTLKVTATVA